MRAALAQAKGAQPAVGEECMQNVREETKRRSRRWGKIARAVAAELRVEAPPRSLAEALHKKRVVITGASSGIGRAVAQLVAAHGGVALLVARRRDKLEEVQAEIVRAGGEAELFTADLSRAEDCERLVSELLAAGQVDVLINNAGRSIRRSLRHAYDRSHDFERTMALNYFGSLRLILGLMPGMRARKSGHIINVSSAGVLSRTPRFAAYIASKAALDAFTQVAAAEAYGDRVYFSTVYMPLVRTPMIEPTAIYRKAPALTPEQAAELTLSALLSRKSKISTMFGNWMAASHALRPIGTLRVLNAVYRMTAGGERARPVAKSHSAVSP
jgi:short-subunit dehydrogenase